jgi:dihydroorotate dehydrogenase electron transfer subunit
MSAPTLHRRLGEVVANRPLGAYRQLSVVLPTLPAPVRPGQFVVVPSGRPDRVLPRTWWVAGERSEAGFGSTLELVVAQPGDGPQEWLPEPGQSLPVTGPLGRGFGLPTTPVTAVVVTQGAAGAVGRWLAERLGSAGCSAHLVSCAQDPELHVDLVQARRSADGVVLTDPVGVQEAVTDLAHRLGAAVLYAAGPVELSRRVAAVAGHLGRVSQLAVLDVGAEGVCGSGLCGACDLPLASRRRSTGLRPCTDGPVVRGDVVAWGELG